MQPHSNVRKKGVICNKKILDNPIGLASGRRASQIRVSGLITIDLPLMFKAVSNIM
jgi:hypothetical protein